VVTLPMVLKIVGLLRSYIFATVYNKIGLALFVPTFPVNKDQCCLNERRS
jgi:hypothetical protein